MEDKDFLDQLITIHECNARLETKVDGINNRLDKLNGNVAEHGQQIEEQKIANVKSSTQLSTAIKIISGIAAAGVLGGNASNIVKELVSAFGS